MPSLARAVALALLATGLAGCELVFGLDDYARAPGAGTSVGAAGGEGGADGTGGTGGATSSSTATTVATASSSVSSSSGGEVCPCVPDGWVLTAAFPATLEAAPRQCNNSVPADRALVGADVRCACSCEEAPALGCSLVCWEQPGCTGAARILQDTLSCETIDPVARSCALAVVQGGAPATALCQPSAAPSVTAQDAVDLCVSAADGAGCPGDGLCEAPPAGALWCLRGPADATCPAGWPLERDVGVGGTAACAPCECVDGITCSGTAFTGDDGNCSFGGTTYIDESRTCIPTGDANRHIGSPVRKGGACVPVTPETDGTLDGAPHTLCCQP